MRLNFFRLDLTQLLKFLITGFTAVLIDAVVYFLLNYFFLSPELSKRISFIAGASFVFFINRTFVFEVRKKNAKQYLLFSILYFISFSANVFSHDLIIRKINNLVIAFLTATSISTIINYIGQKYIVFNVKK